MARVVREHTEHEARSICQDVKKHAWYLRPGVDAPTCKLSEREKVHEWIEWADVIHCMANASPRILGVPDLLTKKIWVFQWHGMQILRWDMLFKPGDERFVRWAHIGQGWIEYSRQQAFFARFNPTILPNVITIDDEIHTPTPFRNRSPRRVAFSPSTFAQSANQKGVDVVRGACKGFDLDLIHGASFEACMRRKAKAYVGIDEVVTPLYHRSALEFLALGVPCLESWGPAAARDLKEATGAEEVPFLPAKPETLRQTLRKVLSDVDTLEGAGAECRAWMEKYYHPRDLIGRYLKFYEE